MANKWQKPELIILYRALPEEAILLHCKHKDDTPAHPAAFHDNCNSSDLDLTCSACSSNANRS